MEYIDYEKRNQKKTETFILILFSLHNAWIVSVSLVQEWERWITIVMFMNVVISWLAYVGRYKTYRFRTLVTTVAMQVNLLLYAMQAENLLIVFSMFSAFIVCIGLYGNEDLIKVTTASTVFLFFYHVLIAQTIKSEKPADVIRLAIQLLTLLWMNYVVGVWVKQRNESNILFQQTIENLRNAEQSKDDFLANVSHEIRTPINTICGLSEVTMHEDEPAKIRENVKSIQIAGRNLMSVVGDILDFSELQSGKVELEEEAYNITSTINDVIQMTMAKMEKKTVDLMVDCDAKLPRVLYGDEKKIRRVIMNIVDNAVKFTSNGYINIGITYRKETYGINLIVTVKDTGIGMKEESVERVFTRFNQVDTRRNRQESGIGLGLAISQAIVQKMDGVIGVKSKYGKGTMVKFVIPQKVLDENPITEIADKEKLNLAVYLNMEQFDMMELRDEYGKNIGHMIEQAKVRCQICRNLPELKRRELYEHFTHVFLSVAEYREDPVYFDKLARKTKVVVILDPHEEKEFANPDILRIYRPLYILSVVSVLNGNAAYEDEKLPGTSEKFIAPEAHVLVVDDNVMNLNVAEALLNNYQIKVSRATSGKQALEMIATMRFDFVFMDHMMPEMDGIETFHQIRKMVGIYYQKLPVIALTANAIAGTRERFLEEGFVDFLEKPIERSVLERVLRRNIRPEKLILVSEIAKEETAEKESELPENKPLVSEAVFTYRENESLPQEDVISEKSKTQQIPEAVEGLDLEIGLLYCGGMEGYRRILMCCSESGDENIRNVDELFEKQNWKDYTIAVHGIKSAMMSIGAVELSGAAKKLEMAGKSEDIAYILENHFNMIELYKQVMKNIRKNPLYALPEQAQEWAEELPEITDERFDAIMEQLEEAMYALDAGQMEKHVAELEKYCYRGVSLKETLAVVLRKIKMCDYMSAVEALQKARERILSSEERGDGMC